MEPLKNMFDKKLYSHLAEEIQRANKTFNSS